MSDKAKPKNPMRWRETCPDCGYILEPIDSAKIERDRQFVCPRCDVHYGLEDFMEEMNQKHMAQHHRHAKADLTGEQE